MRAAHIESVFHNKLPTGCDFWPNVQCHIWQPEIETSRVKDGWEMDDFYLVYVPFLYVCVCIYMCVCEHVCRYVSFYFRPIDMKGCNNQ